MALSIDERLLRLERLAALNFHLNLEEGLGNTLTDNYLSLNAERNQILLTLATEQSIG